MLEIDARIVAACMRELNIKEVDSHPGSDVLPTNLCSAPRMEKQQFLKSLAERLVDKYILNKERVVALLDKVQMAEKEEKERMNTSEGARFKCRFEGCRKPIGTTVKEKSARGFTWLTNS